MSPPYGSEGNRTRQPYLQPGGRTPYMPGAGDSPHSAYPARRGRDGEDYGDYRGGRGGDYRYNPRSPWEFADRPRGPHDRGQPQTAPEPATPHPLAGLAQWIADWVQNPSRFDMEAVQAARDEMRTQLQSDIDIDAARRGVSFGSIPTSIFGREMARADTDLMTRMAETQGEDRMRAMAAALDFVRAAQSGMLGRAGLALDTARLGSAQTPTMQALLQALLGQGFQGSGSTIDPAIFSMLGQIFG